MRWKEAGVKELYAGHCTGGDSLPHLQEIFGASVRFFGTGDVFQF